MSVKNFALALFSTSTLLAFTADPRHALVAGAGYVPRSWVHFQDARASTISVDDALVLGAIIEHTILPEVRRSNSGRNRAVVVLIQDRSLALCRNSQEPQTRCRIPEHWRQFLVPDPARGWPGMIADDRRRRELVESLEARNAVAHALPATGHPAVALIRVIICARLFLRRARPRLRVVWVWESLWLLVVIRARENRWCLAGAISHCDCH